MRNLILIAIVVLIWSCDNREDYFLSVNQKPKIKIVMNGMEVEGNVLEDSIKIGYSRNYKITVEDEEDLGIEIIKDEGIVVVYDNGYSFNATDPGKKSVKIQAVDSYGFYEEKEIKFTSFNNLKPIAKFTVLGLGNLEIEVNASTSKDMDAKFGGRIVQYEYTLNGQVVTTTLNTIRYVFGTSGSKRIDVRVKDNNNEWSPVESLFFSV